MGKIPARLLHAATLLLLASQGGCGVSSCHGRNPTQWWGHASCVSCRRTVLVIARRCRSAVALAFFPSAMSKAPVPTSPRPVTAGTTLAAVEGEVLGADAVVAAVLARNPSVRNGRGLGGGVGPLSPGAGMDDPMVSANDGTGVLRLEH